MVWTVPGLDLSKHSIIWNFFDQLIPVYFPLQFWELWWLPLYPSYQINPSNSVLQKNKFLINLLLLYYRNLPCTSWGSNMLLTRNFSNRLHFYFLYFSLRSGMRNEKIKIKLIWNQEKKKLKQTQPLQRCKKMEIRSH